jgi:hypothetical protein
MLYSPGIGPDASTSTEMYVCLPSFVNALYELSSMAFKFASSRE